MTTRGVRGAAAALATGLLLSAGAVGTVAADPLPADDAPAPSADVVPLAPPPAPPSHVQLLEPDPDPGAAWPEPDLPELAAWILVEGATGQVLAAEAADLRRPVASTVKVLTALAVIGAVDLDEEVTVGGEVLDVPGASVDLEPGERWTVAELLDGLLSRSGNDAAEALVAHVDGALEPFLERMETTARDLGVDGLELVSASGLDDDNRLSAADLATLGRAGLADPRLRPFLGARTVVLPGRGELETRNLLLDAYPGATGVKTGFTEAAGNSLVASAVRDDRELVAVVLGAGDDPERFEAAATLLDLGFEAFDPTEVTTTLQLAVAGGEVTLEVPPVTLTVPVDELAVFDLAVPDRVPDAAPAATLRVAGTDVAAVDTEVDTSSAPGEVHGDAALGRALVDGVYATMRAAAAAEHLR